MTKKDIKKAIENVLKNSKKSLTESDIERKTGINYWEVVKVVDSFKRQGLVEVALSITTH